jgi:hypothetical protein
VVEQQGTIGVFGAFHTDAFDAQLRARILGAELARRRPDHVVRCFAPFDAGAPFPGGSTEPVEPLTDLGGRPWPEIAAELDLAVVTVDRAAAAASLTASLAQTTAVRTPVSVVWHAVGTRDVDTAPAAVESAAVARRISMLDDGSPDRWRAAGGPAVAAVVPHPGVLAGRVFVRDVLDARLELLRALDAWPHDGHAIVLHGGAAHVDTIDALRAPEGSALVVLGVSTHPGEAEFAAAVVARDPSARLIPNETSADDRVAAIAGAAGVVSSSPAVIAVARAFGVPHASMEALRERGSVPIVDVLPEPSSIDDDLESADDDLDAVAALAAGPPPTRLAWSRLAAAEAGLDARGRRLATERAAMADAVVHERERARVLEQRLAELQVAYDDVRKLEVVRWRLALGKLRTRLGLRLQRRSG